VECALSGPERFDVATRAAPRKVRFRAEGREIHHETFPPRSLIPALLCALVLYGAGLAEEAFAPRAGGLAGLTGDRIALFLPADLPLDGMPPSLCLLESPRLAGPLPANWTVVAVVFFSERLARAAVAIPDGTSLYGTGEVAGPLLRNGRRVTLWNTDNFNYRDAGGQRL